MVIGGFNHYDFKEVEISETKVVIPGIYDYLELNYKSKKPFIFTGLNFDSSLDGVTFFPNTYIGGISLFNDEFGILLPIVGDPSTTLNLPIIYINSDDEVKLEYYPFPLA